jgi:hypothetical protein
MVSLSASRTLHHRHAQWLRRLAITKAHKTATEALGLFRAIAVMIGVPARRTGLRVREVGRVRAWRRYNQYMDIHNHRMEYRPGPERDSIRFNPTWESRKFLLSSTK